MRNRWGWEDRPGQKLTMERVITLGSEMVEKPGQKLAGEGRVAAAHNGARRLPRRGVGSGTTGERARLGAPQPRIPERGCCRMARASCEGSPGPPAARSKWGIEVSTRGRRRSKKPLFSAASPFFYRVAAVFLAFFCRLPAHLPPARTNRTLPPTPRAGYGPFPVRRVGPGGGPSRIRPFSCLKGQSRRGSEQDSGLFLSEGSIQEGVRAG